MNRLEIFQEVYGKDYVFTETELSQLQQVAELIVRECMDQVREEVLNGNLQHKLDGPNQSEMD